MTTKRAGESNSDMHIGKLENRVTRLEEGQQTLIAGMSRIETIAGQLVENQRGVFGRLNKPWQWSVVVAIFAALFSLSGGFATAMVLVIDPIKASIARIQEDDQISDARNRAMHEKMTDEIHQNEIASAVNAEALRWVEKVEERYFLTTVGTSDKGPGCCNARKHGE